MKVLMAMVTAELAVFIRDIDNEYNVTDEMASVVPLKHTTKSLDLYKAVKVTFKWFSLTFVNISGNSYRWCPGDGW